MPDDATTPPPQPSEPETWLIPVRPVDHNAVGVAHGYDLSGAPGGIPCPKHYVPACDITTFLDGSCTPEDAVGAPKCPGCLAALGLSEAEVR